VEAWNQLVQYRDDLEESAGILTRYRARELLRLIREGKKLEQFDYVLSLKVLDHIEVGVDGGVGGGVLGGDENLMMNRWRNDNMAYSIT